MRAALAGLLVVAMMPIARAAPGDDLPLLARVPGTRARVVVRGEVTARDKQKVVDLVNHVIEDVEHRFTAKHAPDPTVTLLVFSDPARYRAVAAKVDDSVPSDWGFYLPSQRLAIANVGASIGNLRHELVH